jgi:hypothetical protein
MSQIPKLSRMESVSLREAWGNEANDFTPWLAKPENITLLGEAIGIELEVDSQEKGVGPFRADILCRDTSSNHHVVIENQLERTDHNHLGQLLTYAAGLEATTVVWVAAHFTDEHRAALDWLNNATTAELNFFGLEIELWRIADSPFAPKFNVVCKPNDWSKSVRIVEGMSDFQRLHLEFWTQFQQYLKDNGSTIKIGKPSADHWNNVAVGRSGFTISPWNGMRDNRSGVEFTITSPDAKQYFDLLLRDFKSQIDEALQPFGPVEWRRMEEYKQSKISIMRTSKPSQQRTWPELNKWMKETLEAMSALFKPIVKDLDVSEFPDADNGGVAEQ